MDVATTSPSSSSKKYKVFLSFRGEDTRRSFTCHLHKALCLEGIETLMDYEVPKVDDIFQSLIQEIEDSSLFVIVFSKNYASSKWCLNELIEILRCKQEKGQFIVPIFYQVDPSHVRRQRGPYRKAFAQHLKQNPDKVDQWGEALLETGNLSGWDSCHYRNDAELVENIVNDIKKLRSSKKYEVFLSFRGEDTHRSFTGHLYTALCLKGIETFMDYEVPKGDDISQSIMQAIGNSSLSLVVLSENYGSSRWCLNELIEILRCKNEKGQLVVPIFYQVDPSHVRRQRGPYKKAFAQHLKQNPDKVDLWRKALFETASLAGWDSCNCRDEAELIQHIVSDVMRKLNHGSSRALSKLERRTHRDIQVVLKLSYDRLDDDEKEVFLDIACFLKGESEESVLAMLESCGFHVHISLSTLMDKVLMSIDRSVVRMHDLIQSMAFEIVYQEYLTNPERCRRLVSPDDIFDVLKHNRGSDTIHGISLDLSQIRDLQLSTDTFKKMTNLRFLKFSSWAERSCAVILPSELDSFSKSLRYLQWDNFPSKSLLLSFCAEKLITLHMPNSHIKKLWDGAQNLVSLREIDLSGSNYLMELPDISKAQNLKKLHLGFCTSLKSLKAERLPKSIKMKVVFCCSGLKEFSFSSNKMEKLYLGYMPIEILDFPTGGMEKLKELILGYSKLKNLPIDAIGCMRSLLDLRLFDCGESKLHNLFDSLLSLETIYFPGACKLIELPHNIKHLSRLRNLIVRDCKSLQSLPELPPSIEYLDASDCTSLYSLDLATAPPLRFLLLKDCLKLENRYMESACFPLKRAIYTRKACEICYPGRKVPKWFKSNQGIYASNNISIVLPSTTTDLIGFVLCSVLSHPAHGHLQCQLYYDGKKPKCSKFHNMVKDFDSHHVFLWCVSDMFINFGKTMDDQNTNYRPNVSFEFSIVIDSEKFVDDVIEVCGVCPIYASEYTKFIQQMELEANLGAQKETCQDVDVNSFHGILKYANFSLQTGKCHNLEGSNIPEWFTYKSSKIVESSCLYLRIEVAPNLDKLMGFIFCFVIPDFSSKERDQCYSTFRGQLEYEGYYDASFDGPIGWHYSMRKLNSDDVFLWYCPFLSECILKVLKNLRLIAGCDAKLNLNFFLNLGYGLTDDEMGETDDETGETEDERGATNDETREIRIDNCLMKEFGVRLIYVSEYTNFLQQEKLKEVKDSSIDQSIPENSESSTSHDVDELLLLLALRNF